MGMKSFGAQITRIMVVSIIIERRWGVKPLGFRTSNVVASVLKLMHFLVSSLVLAHS
jgi:hypothetical protein